MTRRAVCGGSRGVAKVSEKGGGNRPTCMAIVTGRWDSRRGIPIDSVPPVWYEIRAGHTEFPASTVQYHRECCPGPVPHSRLGAEDSDEGMQGTRVNGEVSEGGER